MSTGAGTIARRWGVTLVVLALAFTSSGGASPPGDSPPSSLVVFLVRHAEKASDGSDPGLTPEGLRRAEQLAEVLRGAGIDRVHSTDYRRTRMTAEPTARLLEREVELYDPRALPTLVVRLHEAGGRHLVVGHSNTTPALVSLLGGEPGEPIDEEREYDRLYVVRVGEEAPVETILLRYGAHPGPADGP